VKKQATLTLERAFNQIRNSLGLKIFIGSDPSRIIEAGVRVVWRQFEKGSGYRIGVKFIHIPSEEKIKLEFLLKNLGC
jgi:hypothetical protein